MRPPFWGGNLGLLLDLLVCFRNSRCIFFSLLIFLFFVHFFGHKKIYGTQLCLKVKICSSFSFSFFSFFLRRSTGGHKRKCKMNGMDGFILLMATTLQ